MNINGYEVSKFEVRISPVDSKRFLTTIDSIDEHSASFFNKFYAVSDNEQVVIYCPVGYTVDTAAINEAISKKFTSGPYTREWNDADSKIQETVNATLRKI